MRAILFLLLTALLLPNVTFAAPKHLPRVHNAISEHGHKKRMKKAAKQDPGAKKHSLLHHH